MIARYRLAKPLFPRGRASFQKGRTHVRSAALAVAGAGPPWVTVQSPSLFRTLSLTLAAGHGERREGR